MSNYIKTGRINYTEISNMLKLVRHYNKFKNKCHMTGIRDTQEIEYLYTIFITQKRKK